MQNIRIGHATPKNFNVPTRNVFRKLGNAMRTMIAETIPTNPRNVAVCPAALVGHVAPPAIAAYPNG
jgi:hypothetical protein